MTIGHLFATTLVSENVEPEAHIPFFPYIALISAFAAQMALLEFIFSSLYLSRNVSLYGRGLFPCMSEREREVRRKKKKKSPEKNESP